MMIGVSMAAAMIICIAAFIWLYVQIGPLLSDFIPEDTAGNDGSNATNIIGAGDATATPEAEDGDDEFSLDEIEPEPMETSQPADDEDDQDESESGSESDGSESDEEDEDEFAIADWDPTHQIREGPNVNFRSGPNTISQPQGALAPGTPLEFLDDEEPTGGVTWMYFEIQDGTEGWIRDIDVVEIELDDVDPGSE